MQIFNPFGPFVYMKTSFSHLILYGYIFDALQSGDISKTLISVDMCTCN